MKYSVNKGSGIAGGGLPVDTRIKVLFVCLPRCVDRDVSLLTIRQNDVAFQNCLPPAKKVFSITKREV